jgi:hypothetical protein
MQANAVESHWPVSAQFRYNRRLEMYKALHMQEGREIVILDSHWTKGIEHLRALDQQDLLVCQVSGVTTSWTDS